MYIRAFAIPKFCVILVFAGCARHYKVDGLVLRSDPLHRTVVVSHRDISGYMPAMVMPFRVKDARELAALRPGSRVRFQLSVKRHSALAEHISVAASGDAPAPVAPRKLPIGATAPAIPLMDERGQAVNLADFRGKVVVIDFIYTRCPLPEVCPRLSANFASLQRCFAARLGHELVLVSITLDPQYDTPAVLARYAKLWNANPAGWRFWTGPVSGVQAMAEAFGMVYWTEEGTVAHTSETAVIGRDGRLAALVDGAGYAVSQLGDLIALQLEEK